MPSSARNAIAVSFLLLGFVLLPGCGEDTQKEEGDVIDTTDDADGQEVCQDQDSDGYPDVACGGTDCNDLDGGIHPGAQERCDGRDNDCDEEIDEGLELSTWYEDNDGDGYGSEPIEACAKPPGIVAEEGGDCNDDDAFIHPFAIESCNEIDDNCNDEVDEGLPTSTWYRDADGDGRGTPDEFIEACDGFGDYVDNAEDCDDSRPTVYEGAAERCDNVDNDCDEVVDNDLVASWYLDVDGDLYGDPNETWDGCDAPDRFVAVAEDCNDRNGDVNPDAAEVCNGIDDNCDTNVDEGVLPVWYRDVDGDTFGDPSAPNVEACTRPAGYVANNEDCDDDDPTSYPGGIEVCDGADNNCAGGTDEGLTRTYYRDEDGDGIGRHQYRYGCSAPIGYVPFVGDCDDYEPLARPGLGEVCDQIDNDCDGEIDEGLRPTLYRDADQDGHGDPNNSTTSLCAPNTDWVTSNDDYDDTRDTVFGGNPMEICDGLDNNCNGERDENDPRTSWYLDSDGDNYGDPNVSVLACGQPPGYVADDTDCYDLNAEAHPGQTGYPGQNGICKGQLIIGTCSMNDRGDGSYDYNCDGVETRWNTNVVNSCSGNCGQAGWVNSAPSCNQRQSYKSCADGCNGSVTVQNQCQCCN